jgi:hypothetical protein
MDKRLLGLVLILVLGACTPTPTAMPTLTSPISSPPAISSVTSSAQNASPAASLSVTETAIPVTEAPTTLTLQVLSPQDEAVVNVPQVDITGLAPVGAVVSINDEILIVGADGQFSTPIALDQGPNVIEIVASDENANETSLILTVTYEP